MTKHTTRVPIRGTRAETVEITVSGRDALAAAWRAWLIEHVSGEAAYRPPQAFEIRDGAWFRWYSKFHSQPFPLDIAATPEHVIAYQAFKVLDELL
jgi:hypothetical protein